MDYYPSSRDSRFHDLPMEIAAIMNTGNIDEMCTALSTQPRYVADTALFRAAQFNQAALIKPLVERCSANVNAVDPRQNDTPLHVAADQRAVETAEALLAAGAAANKKNKTGNSPLMAAVRQLVWQNLPGRAVATIAALLTAGYVPSRDVWNEETPMTFAAGQGNQEVVKMLLAAGAAVNSSARAQGYKQFPESAPIGFWSPLHAAAQKGDKAMVALLLAVGADPNGRDNKGRTPLHCAAKYDESGCYGLLVDAGADVRAYDLEWNMPR